MATRESLTRLRKTERPHYGEPIRDATEHEYRTWAAQSAAMGGDPPPAATFFPTPREASE
jgi:fibrillarin-like rRNA methylase